MDKQEKKRSGIHSVVRHEEAVGANQEVAEEFIQEFSDYIKSEGFLPQQMFNCDGINLFYKKLKKNKKAKDIPYLTAYRTHLFPKILAQKIALRLICEVVIFRRLIFD